MGMADFKSEWPTSSRNHRPTSNQNQWPASVGIRILDNYATHKTEAVKRWLARHPRFHVHFTPTSASWINAVEGLFATLTRRRLKRGVFRSVTELNHAIRDYLDAHNANPKPFRWTAPADTIIGKHQRGKRLLESLH
jgi:transposase